MENEVKFIYAHEYVFVRHPKLLMTREIARGRFDAEWSLPHGYGIPLVGRKNESSRLPFILLIESGELEIEVIWQTPRKPCGFKKRPRAMRIRFYFRVLARKMNNLTKNFYRVIIVDETRLEILLPWFLSEYSAFHAFWTYVKSDFKKSFGYTLFIS